MKTETEEVLAAVYKWVDENRASATEARNGRVIKSLPNVMLAGKVQAYVDVLCFIRSRWGDRLDTDNAKAIIYNHEP